MDRREREEALLDELVGLDADRREQVLAERCEGDEDLLTEMRRLLRAVETAPPDSNREYADGERLGSFSLIRRLGAGASGEVWHVRNEDKQGRHSALKLFKAVASANAAQLERVIEEAASAANIQHENIVRVRDAGRIGHVGPFYIELELAVENPADPPEQWRVAKTLADEAIVLGRPRYSHRECAEIVARACRGLAVIHNHGKLHRDFKPRNVLVRADGHPYVADFGLSVARGADENADASDAAGLAAGTPGYMAPEQKRGQALAASDVFSVGATLYFMLTGHAPTSPVEASAWDAKRGLPCGDRDDAVVRPLQEEGVPRPLAAICLYALRQDPTNRYQSALELVQELDVWLSHKPINVVKLGTFGRARLWWRRNPILASAAGLLMLGTAVFTWQLMRQVTLKEEQRQSAVRQALFARAGQAAVLSATLGAERPQLAALLAGEAVRMTQRAGEPLLAQADMALRTVLSEVGGMPLTGHSAGLWLMHYDPERALLYSLDRSGALRRQRFPESQEAWHEVDDHTRMLHFRSQGHWEDLGADKQQSELQAAGVSLDGRWMLTLDQNGGGLLRRVRGQGADDAARFIAGDFVDFAFSVDGNWLVLLDRQLDPITRSSLWDLRGNVPRRVALPIPTGRRLATGWVRSPDLRHIAAATDVGTALLWSRATETADWGEPFVVAAGEFLTPLCFLARTTSLAIMDGGGRIRTCDRGEDGVWTLGPAAEMTLPQGSVFRASPDGRHLAFWAWERPLWLLSRDGGHIRTRELQQKMHTNEPYGWHVVFSPDSGSMFVICDDGSIGVWDISAARAPVFVRYPGATDATPMGLAVLAEGTQLLAYAADGSAAIWELRGEGGISLQRYLSGNSASIGRAIVQSSRPAIMSADERWLVTIDNLGVARLSDLSGVREPTALRCFDGRTQGAAFSSDNRWLFLTSDDGQIRTWDLTAPQLTIEPRRFPNTTDRADPSVSPTGRWCYVPDASGGGRVWSLARPASAYEGFLIEGHEGPKDAVFLGTRDQWLLTYRRRPMSVDPDFDPRCLLWDLDNAHGEPAALSEDRDALWQPSDDGRWLAVQHPNGSLVVRDLDCSRAASHLESTRGAEPYFALGGEWLFLVGKLANVDVVSLGPCGATQPILLPTVIPSVYFTCASDGTAIFAAGDADKPASVVELPPRVAALRARPLAGTDQSATAIGFSGDGSWMATSSSAGRLELWDLLSAELRPILLGTYAGSIPQVTFSARSGWLTVWSEGEIARAWRLDRRAPIAKPAFDCGGSARSVVVVSPAETHVALLCNRSLELCNVDSDGRALNTAVLLRDSDATNVEFAPKGGWLVSTGEKDAARIWRLVEGRAEPEFEVTIDPANGAGRCFFEAKEERWLVTGADQASASGSDFVLWNLNARHPSVGIDGYKIPHTGNAAVHISGEFLVLTDKRETRVYELSVNRLLELAGAFAARSMTAQERGRYLPIPLLGTVPGTNGYQPTSNK